MKTTNKLSGNRKPGNTPGRFSAKNLFKSAGLILAILTLCVATPSANAYNRPANSELNIRLHDNNVFNIRINNLEYNNFNTRYTINHLAPGRHFIQITRFKSSYNGRNHIYQFPQVVFSGHVTIKAGTKVFACIDSRGRYKVEQTIAMHTPGPPAHAAVHNRAPRNNPYANNYTYYEPVMSPHSFNMLMNTLAANSFDSSRLNIAQQAIAANNVTSEQVYQLMTMMSFESNKLKLAQFAYPYTVDKGNYFMVHNAFSFSSSSHRLNTYIAQLR